MTRNIYWTLLTALIYSLACHSQNQQEIAEMYANLWKQEEMEGKTFYANADTAEYGIRYQWSYMYDKTAKRVYREDRIVMVSPRVTLDTSYQPIGEKLWILNHPTDGWVKHDPTLPYRLTPSYYFYYPQEKRLIKTYRVISDEFLLEDTICNNQWNITDEYKEIANYHCRKATCQRDGRTWIAWFTNELPYTAAPRQLTGLPGVVLAASDEEGEIKWSFRGKITPNEKNPLFIKFPDRFSSVPVSRFPTLLRIYATADTNLIQWSGIMQKTPGALPAKYYPSTGIDACHITNPIERNN